MDTMMISNGYQLTILQDEEVALAGGIPTKLVNTQFFTVSLICVFLIAFVILFTVYMTRLHSYKVYVTGLSERVSYGQPVYQGFSLRALKMQARALEEDVAADNLDSISGLM